jgi:hypothetical protein
MKIEEDAKNKWNQHEDISRIDFHTHPINDDVGKKCQTTKYEKWLIADKLGRFRTQQVNSHD